MGKKAAISSQITVGEGAAISTITGSGFAGDGSGLLKISSIAVNAVQDASIVGVTATKLSGTINDARYGVNVTTQGNTFNGVSQLVRLGADGYLPVLNGSNLTNLATQITYKQVGGYNGALGAGTTFFAMVPTADVVITKIVVTIVSAGEGGTTGAVWKCGSTAANMLTVTSGAALAAGSVVSAVGTITVNAATNVSGWMDSSDETITPSANVVCEYK